MSEGSFSAVAAHIVWISPFHFPVRPCLLKIWVQLFETNDVVSLRIVQTYIIK